MRAAVLLVACGCLTAPSAHAQVLYGSIVGNVQDSSGAALPGATVTITSKETNLTRSGVTNEIGTYSFTNVQIGRWDVKVTLQGFRENVRTQVPVTVVPGTFPPCGSFTTPTMLPYSTCAIVAEDVSASTATISTALVPQRRAFRETWITVPPPTL